MHACARTCTHEHPLRWKAAISLGKALACGLIYALLHVPLWPIFAILVFWLNWVSVHAYYMHICYI